MAFATRSELHVRYVFIRRRLLTIA